MTYTPGIMGLSGTRYRMNSAEWQNLSIGDQFIAAVGIDPRGLEGLSDGIRLRDCWNACEGITDPSVVPELLAALESPSFHNLCISNPKVSDEWEVPMMLTIGELRRIAAIIAKAKGAAK